MITLYAFPTPNNLKVVLALEELGLPYDLKAVNIRQGEQKAEAFLALNQNGKVPVLVDSDGPEGELVLTESAAILVYLAEKTGRFLPARGAVRYQVLEWLAVQMCGVGPMFGQYTHFRVFAPKGNDYAESRYRTQAVRLFEALDHRLGQTRFLGGEDYSIADMATFPWTRDRSGKWGGDWGGYKNFNRWFDDVSARPAVSRMTAEMDKVWQEDLVSIGAAPVEIRDRLLGRGEFAKAPSA